MRMKRMEMKIKKKIGKIKELLCGSSGFLSFNLRKRFFLYSFLPLPYLNIWDDDDLSFQFFSFVLVSIYTKNVSCVSYDNDNFK